LERPDDAQDEHGRLHHRAQGRDPRHHGDRREAPAHRRHPGPARHQPLLERARERALRHRSRAGERKAAWFIEEEARHKAREEGREEKKVSKTVGVIGLGIMGSAMSANLVKVGFAVQGYDVLPARRDDLKKAGGSPVQALTAIEAPVVISSLPSAEALHAVAGEMTTKCIVVETSTLPIDDKLKARDVLSRKGITL